MHDPLDFDKPASTQAVNVFMRGCMPLAPDSHRNTAYVRASSSKRPSPGVVCVHVCTCCCDCRMRLCWASAADIGPRDGQEDRYTAVVDVNSAFSWPAECSHRVGYFGVFDGHNGDDTSTYLSLHLHERLLAFESLFLKNPREHFVNAYHSIDQEVGVWRAWNHIAVQYACWLIGI